MCAGLAVWLWAGQDQGMRRARLMFAGAGTGAETGSGTGAGAGLGGFQAAVAGGGFRASPLGRWLAAVRHRERWRAEWLCLPLGLALAVLGGSVLPLVAGALAVPLLGRRLRLEQRERARARRADQVIAWCAAVAGELRAGRQPGPALVTAARETGALGAGAAPVVAAATFGGDVPAALRSAASEPGAEGLAGIAACWQVAVDGGAGLASGLERLENALRAEREQQDALRSELAGPRTTVLLLALLPALGLVLGTAMGASPLRVLLHSPAGFGCLLVAAVLETAGVVWAARIVRAGEGR
ncbi:type II secretion system F family protein [Streptomyces sp. NBC_00083]|uniref:type II secretion system F family protein n=1 Tax=Streptomyces sp. NBC_00083 TaxID=2975647 RepID=UPI00224F5037|nr:type II secretion system F family protein [Streptomyces sp. NBC_00083]MCX5381703.1 type II secretion system F family protein [Streptomyces sp. NBC_00083]